MAGTAHLVQTCSRRLAEFLREVDETDLVWLAEIRDEAARMFGSDCNDEPELMPKTPSQKNRRRKKRISLVQDENEDPTRKRLSRRRNSSIKPRSSKRYSQKLQNKDDQGKICAAVEEASLHQQVTRSEATAPAKCSEAVPEKSAVKAIEERIPFVEISVSDRSSAELHLQGNVPETADEVSRIICLSSNDESPPKNGMVENQSVLEASVLVVSQTPEVNEARGSRGASKLKIANILPTKATINKEPKEVDGCALGPQDKQTPGKELSQDLKDNAGTPTGSRSSRRSVRRSLMGKTSLTRRTSLAEKYSLASKRESMIRKSVRNSSKKKIRKSSQVSNNVNCYSSIVTLVDEEKTIKNGSVQESSTSNQDPQGPRMSLRTRNAKKIAISNLSSQQQQQEEESSKESNSNESGEILEPPQSVRRKPSYKKAVDQLYDGQQAEEGGLSPPRKKTQSPPCPASKVVRPFKTFLHTVQKNQLLMTPSSVGRNNVVKSFIKHNTPLRTDPKEKERQRLESLRKKQDAEQQRKQKLEEEKRRRVEEMKLKREERLRKVLQARERVEQIEEEKKRRLEQKLAQVDEKTEKVREERLAEEKMKKRAAAKKMEEAEARRKQDEDARKLKALQLEEEEQERVRKIAEQRQAEQERERQLAAERELEKKKEQERIQAERERERQEKEKILRQQKELMAAREKERLQQEMEEKKKREEQRLAELEQQEQERRKLQEEQEKKAKLVEATAGSKQLNVTVDVENSSLCNSYQMTPQGLKGPKPPKINPSNNYGMDLNSDDSTDDESQPRKPIPAWANGSQLSQAVIHQYYNPLNTDMLFGTIISPKLEDIFYKSKPRYFKRTSSAVWNSPPFGGAKNVLGLPYSLKKY